MRDVARFIDEGVKIALKAKPKSGKTVTKFKQFIVNDKETMDEIDELGVRVVEFAKDFHFPGGDAV